MDERLEKELREFLDKQRERVAMRQGAMTALGWIFAPIGIASLVGLLIRFAIWANH